MSALIGFTCLILVLAIAALWLWVEVTDKSVHMEIRWVSLCRGDKVWLSIPTGIRIWFDDEE